MQIGSAKVSSLGIMDGISYAMEHVY